jgi:hypothetical protein|uniref:hypothetical protein n=1 Tax=Prosthecobacter sp. TaxID=1965333 RepID=UPI003785285E
MTTNPKLQIFASSAQSFAMQMMSNASYIQRELPTIEVPNELRAKVEAVCDSLIGTKHDVITELFELDEQTRAGVSEEKLSEKMGRVVRWLCESNQEMHELVQEVEQLVSKDSCYGLLFILIIESATNIANSLPGALSDEE